MELEQGIGSELSPFEQLVSAFRTPTVKNEEKKPKKQPPKEKRKRAEEERRKETKEAIEERKVKVQPQKKKANRAIEAEEEIEERDAIVHRGALNAMDRVLEGKQNKSKKSSASTSTNEVSTKLAAEEKLRHEKEDAQEANLVLDDLKDEENDEESAKNDGDLKSKFDQVWNTNREDAGIEEGGKEKEQDVKTKEDSDLGIVSYHEEDQNILEQQTENSVGSFGVKTKLVNRWSALHSTTSSSSSSSNSNGGVFESDLQRKIFGIISEYKDLLVIRNSTEQQNQQIQDDWLLHIINHISKSQERELRHTARRNEAKFNSKLVETPTDRGFTKTRALVILPFRSFCYNAVMRMIELLPDSLRNHVESLAKFKVQYFEDSKPAQLRIPRPNDYDETFKGNTDDCFSLGVTFTRQSVRLFTTYSKSDIIFASPLGLKILIGDEGDKQRDVDLLSSVEILVVDKAELLLMQNWEHVQSVFKSVNLLPKKSSDADFTRIRQWCLEGKSKYYRQSIIISKLLMPEINSVFNKYCLNTLGKIKAISVGEPSISKVALKVRQVFQRIECKTIQDKSDSLFTYFKTEVLPHLTSGSIQNHTIIYIASYFDFIRIRNLFASEDLNFSSVNEHSVKADQNKARGHFSNGKVDFMLYTERFHFYHRYSISGAHNAIFYGLPTFPQFYYEIVNSLTGSSAATVLALFTKYDRLQLDRIVGSNRSSRLVQSEKTTHLFC